MNPDEIKRSILDFIFNGEYQKAKDYIDILLETETNSLYDEGFINIVWPDDGLEIVLDDKIIYNDDLVE